MDEKQLMKFKVTELKEKLTALGIPPKGLKADLVRQLLKAYEDQNNQLYEMQPQMQQQLPPQQYFHLNQFDNMMPADQTYQMSTMPQNSIFIQESPMIMQGGTNVSQYQQEHLPSQQFSQQPQVDILPDTNVQLIQQQQEQQRYQFIAEQQQQEHQLAKEYYPEDYAVNPNMQNEALNIPSEQPETSYLSSQVLEDQIESGQGDIEQTNHNDVGTPQTYAYEANLFNQQQKSANSMQNIENVTTGPVIDNVPEEFYNNQPIGSNDVEFTDILQQQKIVDFAPTFEDELVLKQSSLQNFAEAENPEQTVNESETDSFGVDLFTTNVNKTYEMKLKLKSIEESNLDINKEQEGQSEDESNKISVNEILDNVELSKLTKNQRRKYKKKIRNKIKRIERDEIERKKEIWLAKLLEHQKIIEEKLKLEEKELLERQKREVDEDEDKMDIDEEDEAEDEKEKRRIMEEELKLKRQREEEERQKEKEYILKGLVDEVEIEYVPEEIPKDAFYLQFLKVFDKFNAVSAAEARELEAEQLAEHNKNRDDRTKLLELKKPVELELKDEDDKTEGSKVSKRKMKQMLRMNISDLKQKVSHPELVEMHDITAKDPVLLLYLKSSRNTVPVPRHWCYKRKYLQGKRGFEKPPFKLPEFIRRTGIQEMREAIAEKEDSKSLKNKMREKIRPKMGKIDIDYQKLHDAFFKWQTKPKMTIHGDLYYEGKEFETRLKDKKPGDLSNELRAALGMPTGPNSHKCPPPWLIAMQRYGPPPSYPNIKIPGLNAPIPEGCSFGYHAGGWGKPPVDEYGRPLYGDVFGETNANSGEMHIIEEEVEHNKWGELESEEESEEESEQEEAQEEEGNEQRISGTATPALGHEGLVTPSGISTITGLETPDMVELRKRKQIESEMESGDNPQLFTVIPEKKTDKLGKDMMGSMHVYDFASLSKSHSKPSRNDGVEVTLDPSDLESGQLDSHQMEKRYEQTLREQSGGNPHEDLSDMVAEYNAKKRKKDNKDKSKKYQFKF